MTIRTLVVDDHEAWRRFISASLRKNSQYEVIGEIADGLQAVHAATKLQPDLLVLDVGLPTISGIEVARRILGFLPGVKILFVSEHRSRDIAEAALEAGAHGYVFKWNAGVELLPAVDAIVKGQRFLSAGLEGVPAPTRRHEVEVCADDASLVDGFVRVAEGALRAGNTAIVVATTAHLDALHLRLQNSGVGVDLAVREGRYLSFEAAEVLSTFMVSDQVDESRFWETTNAIVTQAMKGSRGQPPRVVACGECAPTLWNDGHAAAAIRLERLWDEVAKTHAVDICCGYVVRAPLREDENRLFQQICAEHSAVHLCKAS
jgi:DNA-binding response OmpR family regulator